MAEAACEIGPDLAAHVDPALAEGEILAEVDAGLGIDHAFEECHAVDAAGERVAVVVVAAEAERLMALTHFLERRATDHQEARPGAAHAHELAAGLDPAGVLD